MNSEWRKFLASAISVYFSIASRSASEAELDVLEPLISALFDDFYSPSIGGGDLNVYTKSALRIANYVFSAGFNTLPFDGGDYDISNTTRLVIDNTGQHVITANFWERDFGGTSPFANVYIRKNGTDYIAFQDGSGGAEQRISLAWTGNLDSGDYLELIVECQSSNVRIDLSHPVELSLTGFYL